MSDFTTARSIALNWLDGVSPLDEGMLRQAAEIAAQAINSRPGAAVDLEALVRELEVNLNVLVGAASTLTDEQSDHVPWLPEQRASIEWRFSRRYRRFLQEQKGWALPTLRSSDDLTDRILALMENPSRLGTWDRRGMVVGEVQSGKTSNYIELACKAVDAGYKFIVVLTGTTNSLRAQTQLRFDEGFLGWDTRLDLQLGNRNRRVGVGTLLGEVPLPRDISDQCAGERRFQPQGGQPVQPPVGWGSSDHGREEERGRSTEPDPLGTVGGTGGSGRSGSPTHLSWSLMTRPTTPR